jgi:hypothetical protein
LAVTDRQNGTKSRMLQPNRPPMKQALHQLVTTL